MQRTITFPTHSREALYDITREVQAVVAEVIEEQTVIEVNEMIGETDPTGDGLDAAPAAGLCAVYAQGATAAIMIQENWDESVQNDVVSLMQKLVPRGVWEHDRQDGNGDSHLKAGIVGPSETIPILQGRLGLSRWQNIFFCEFDGPREERSVVVTILV